MTKKKKKEEQDSWQHCPFSSCFEGYGAIAVGRVAQWIRRLTTDQAILGSSPGTVGYRFLLSFRTDTPER